MYTAVTEGIRVTVFSQYEELHSTPDANHFMFSYRVRIENSSDSTVQLLRRHWIIFDSAGEVKQVEGPGVVGNTPVLQPGQSYEYNSGCDLHSEFGSMRGQYMMEKVNHQEYFYVEIPRFLLEVPWKLN
jgi:ApaG protein